ncbi:thioredoxin domain-containing protein [Pseudolysinimonas sp.]|uniref:DsbA family protein n=1 Tax=Pseudolysinimonas sp. TaxID=2680009 RepID=UPI00286D48D8|nr:thioredoxin domain-containing protein [Pseudolysinimonas sp.]
MAQDRLTKDQRREQARELARMEREARQKAQSRNRILIRVGATVGAVALLGAVAGGIWLGTRPAGPGPVNMASDGILFVGNDDGEVDAVQTGAVPAEGTPIATDPDAYDVPARIVTYLDYGCPYCNQFETTNASQIADLVAAGYATLEVHPISILDGQFAGSEYPTRAANAMACIAAEEPSGFLDASAALFANQPAEGTEGLTDDGIRDILDSVGALNDEISACIGEQRYAGWVAAATERATSDPDLANPSTGGFGTPTVLINGVRYTGALDDPQAFAAFVAQNADFSESDPTPTP